MSSHLKLRDKTYEVPSGMTVRDALLRLEIEPETVLPTRDGELITDDELLRDGETIRLVAVISGGAVGRVPPGAVISASPRKDAGR